MFYRVKENRLYDYANYKYAEDCLQTNIVTQQELDEHPNKVIINNGILVLNPNYDSEEAEKEAERINHLTMTALDFIGVLEAFGLDYVTEIKPFLEAHQDLDKQLKYCQNVWCGVAKQIFAEPITIGSITITSQMVEQAFKLKNGVE